ncbi:S41 family peptidase [Paenibacillus sp. sptzw28]|uniref:S41 family peptidase n=1 Tax=Paenibacillus sp. sptzw28 TaxID=715179 RepID=UPI001C6EAC42|nr:S41 family peptidase [Paenibacillus sp. sptzw28]QYR23582.1 S41 family peptidase [Paenibacillus sp. sptzw28]
MDHGFKKDTIKALTDLIVEHYVFPETAVSLRSELTQMNEIEYEGFQDYSMFADLLTSKLQSSSGDKHLRIRHCTEKAQVEDSRKNSNEDDFFTMIRLDNYGFTKTERLPGNIGLLQFDAFMPPELAGETVTSAMAFLANTSCMIIDLRNNHGGSPYMVAFISSYLLEPSPTHLNNLYWRKNDETQQFWSLPYVPGKKFGGTKPLYILTSRRTFSAAEEFAYNLQSIGRAIIVGERTGGGAHPGRMHRINREFEVFIPDGRAINPITKDNWEGVGVRPDIEVPEDNAFDTAYTALLEKELKRLSDEPIPGGYERLRDEIKQTLEKKVLA